MERKLGNWINKYIEYTRHDESPEIFHRWTAYVVLSAAINRNCWVDRGYYKLFPNLYVLFIGPSGVGKSTSSGIGIELLRESTLRVNIYKDFITSGALMEFMSRATVNMEFTKGSKTLVIKKTPLLLYASELGNLLSVRSGIRELTLLLTELFNKQGDHEDTTNKRGSISIKKPCVTFFACCFPSWLEEELTSISLRSGFLGRMLVVYANSKRHLAPEIKLTESDKTLRKDLLHDLEIIGALYGPMAFSKEADRFWQSWYQSLPTECGGQDVEIEVDGFLSRKPAFVHRLAMIHSLARDNSMVIDIEDLQEAQRLLNVCQMHMQGIVPTTERFRVLTKIKHNMLKLSEKTGKDVIQKSDLMKRISRFANVKILDEVLEQLILEGQVSLEGRKIKLYKDIMLADMN